jgi:hypothetical protein
MSYFDDKDAAEILGHGALGLDADDIAAMIKLAPTLLGSGHAALKIGRRVVADPHLQEALCEGLRVVNVLDKKPAGKRCPRTGKVSKARLARGVGLNQGLMPARAFILHRQNPWVLPVAIGGLFGLVFLGGFFTGKSRK